MTAIRRQIGKQALQAVVMLLMLMLALYWFGREASSNGRSGWPTEGAPAGGNEAQSQAMPFAASNPAASLPAPAIEVDSEGVPALSETTNIGTSADNANKTFLPLVQNGANSDEWYMLAANPQRTSWVSEEVRGDLEVEWYRPIEPYIPYKVQVIAANGYLFVSTARGLCAFNADNGGLAWVYPTELPLGHSPTIASINGRSVAFVGGYDRKIHAIDVATGKNMSGYSPYEAAAGFETNPLVIGTTVYAGNRDGYFYALDAITGQLRWRYRTDGPILFSAAYKDNVLYFASNDAHAYALNATTGTLIWKSAKLPGQGFHSFWPVVYTEKATGRDFVVFTTGENYRFIDKSLTTEETEYLFSDVPEGGLIGPTSSQPGDWTPGAVTIDAKRITDYYEEYPYRRTVLVLDGSTGQEYTFDSDGDGKAEYAPFTWSGVTHGGMKYPPIVNGVDGVYYQDTAYFSTEWVARGDVAGWKFGTHYISRVAQYSGDAAGTGDAHALDEPMSFSSGGKLIYWSLCCDREAGAYDVTIPYGQENRYWYYWGYSLPSVAPDYQQMYFDGDTTVYNHMDGWQVYSGRDQSPNGIYMKHSSTQSPPIPYRGRVYVLKGNALIAFSPTGGNPTKLPLATVVPIQDSPTPPSPTTLTQRLEAEVDKMLAAGPLRPGYHAAGFIDLYGEGWYDDDREFGEIFDYFQNPADTVVTLLQTLPYLSSTKQQQVKTYLQNYYGPGAPYSFTNVVHVGWNVGASREAYDIPPDIWASKYAELGPSTTPICGWCGYWQWFPPYSFYAAWKYAEAFPGTAKSIFDQMSDKIEAPLSDSYMIEKPYYMNLYIAGYQGYLEIQRLAGYSENTTVRGWYQHLLGLRVSGFSTDTPYFGEYTVGLMNYNRTLSVARNFMFLTPELGDYLNRSAFSTVQDAVAEYTYVAPYWFVSKFDGSYGEGTLEHLYDYPALFQAKAYVLKQPYSELAKWLDVPGFARGDLFYIQNLVAALHSQQ